MLRPILHTIFTAIALGPMLSMGMAVSKVAGITDLTWWQVAAPYLCVATFLGTVVLLSMTIAVLLDIETAPLG